MKTNVVCNFRFLRNPHILPIEIIASSEIYVKNLRHYDLQLRQTNIKKSEEKNVIKALKIYSSIVIYL